MRSSRTTHEYSHEFFQQLFPGQNDCSLAGSLAAPTLTKSESSQSNAQTAPSATLPVDIEIDQFSLKRFGQIGFSPQCLFVDHSAPQGYLESKIANTLRLKRHSIYDHEGFTWVTLPAEVDPYWEYYSDCDAWDVVFAKLPAQTQPLSYYTKTKNAIQYLFQSATESVDFVLSLAKQREFEQVEMRNVNLNEGIPVHETMIDQLKNFRPLIQNVIQHDFVQNPYHWLELKKTQIGDQLDGTPLAIVWTGLTQVQFLGRVSANQANGINRRNGVLKDNFSWIARKIQQVVGTIRLR